MVEIVTKLSNIELELWPDPALKTVRNFAKLSRNGFYEGIYFHRMIPNFMIQGRCPNANDSDRSNYVWEVAATPLRMSFTTQVFEARSDH